MYRWTLSSDDHIKKLEVCNGNNWKICLHTQFKFARNPCLLLNKNVCQKANLTWKLTLVLYTSKKILLIEACMSGWSIDGSMKFMKIELWQNVLLSQKELFFKSLSSHMVDRKTVWQDYLTPQTRGTLYVVNTSVAHYLFTVNKTAT